MFRLRRSRLHPFHIANTRNSLILLYSSNDVLQYFDTKILRRINGYIIANLRANPGKKLIYYNKKKTIFL
jgi:hypothetical protein